MEYKSPVEVFILTDPESPKFSVYDTHTGTSIVNFQNQEPINANCLHVINNSHFITAHENKLHIWSIYNRKCQDQKLFLPGKANCMTVSPCGRYLVVGIGERIFVWQISSGYLMSCISAHYQAVTVLKFNHEGTLLFSSSRDGSVMIWSIADLIAKTNNVARMNQESNEKNTKHKGMRFIWQHHTGSITGVHVTIGGLCLTVSEDSSLNIYNYNDGKRLANRIFPSKIHSIIMDKNETTCYLGCQDGNIYQLATSNLSLAYNLNGTDPNSQKPIFIGHQGPVTLLQISLDGTKLISGAGDKSCKFWDISRRKLIREIVLKSAPFNLQSILVPEGLSLMTMTATRSPPFDIRPLMRSVYNYPPDATLSGQSLLEDCSTTIIKRKHLNSKWEQDILDKQFSQSDTIEQPKQIHIDQENPQVIVEKLRQKVEKIYNIKVETLLNSVSSSSIDMFAH